MTETKKFILVDCGRDEYPGDGLRLRNPVTGALHNKDFMHDMVTVRVVSRMKTQRVPVECNICNNPKCDSPNGKH